MISEKHLYHMYQSWCQGQEDPARDWSYFVEAAARWNDTSGDKIMQILQRTHWFKVHQNFN